MRDALDLSRERLDDDLHGDEFRRRALERADRLREVSDLPEMGLGRGEAVGAVDGRSGPLADRTRPVGRAPRPSSGISPQGRASRLSIPIGWR